MVLNVPEELVCEIMSHLPQGDLGRFTSACRDLYRIGSEDNIWRKKGFLKRKAEDAFAGSELSQPSPRLCHTSVMYNNKMYIFGGHNTEAESQRFSEVKSDLYEYDLDQKTWKNNVISNMPAKTEHCAVVHKSALYLFGGYSGYTFSNSTYMVNLVTGNNCSLVKVTGDIPPGRSAHIGVTYDNKMYTFGGWDGLVQNGDFFMFDFETSHWTKIVGEGALPCARCSHTAIVSNNRKVLYLFGGYGGKSKNYLNDLWEYNFESKQWKCIEAKGDVPSPRSRMKMIEYENKLYIFGGWDKVQHFDELHEFSLETLKWKKIDFGIEKNDNSFKMGQHSMNVHDNILYIFGGFNAKMKKSTNDLYSYRLGKPLRRVQASDSSTSNSNMNMNINMNVNMNKNIESMNVSDIDMSVISIKN